MEGRIYYTQREMAEGGGCWTQGKKGACVYDFGVIPVVNLIEYLFHAAICSFTHDFTSYQAFKFSHCQNSQKKPR